MFEGDVFNTGATYTLNGTRGPADVSFPNGDPSNFAGTALDFIFGGSPVESNDKETYGQFDGTYMVDWGPLTTMKFGVRAAEHERTSTWVAQGPNFAATRSIRPTCRSGTARPTPATSASGLGGTFPRNVWMLSPGELERWGDIYSNRDPVSRRYWPGEFEVKEKVLAGYLMANFEGKGWAGNAGVRVVETKERVLVNVAVPGSVCPPLQPCPQVPNAITTSAFGTFFQQPVENTYTDVLPSANLKWDLSKDLVARFAIARTMARPDYSALGGSVSLEDTTNTGNGGNPNLKPILSNNYDAAIEWYFAPSSLLSAGLFYLDLKNFVSFGTHQQEFFNIRDNQFETFTISSPVNSKGEVKGIELAYQQEFKGGFGIQANYTYADGEEEGGGPLIGTSKNTYNVIGYWENYGWSARLAYTFRSKFFIGLDRSTQQFQDDLGTLAASLSYAINKNFTLTFDALNLNDPTIKYFAANEDQPRAFYKNGRQYYAGVRVKF